MVIIDFDNTWYCDKCNAHFKDEDDFIYCPYCGDVLKNDWYQMDLQSIEEFFNKASKSICEECGEEFDKDYNFCPLCSKELKKENIPFKIEEDNSITADWNGEKTVIFDKDMFISHPHFSGSAVIKSFEFKESMDYKLMKLGLKPSEKLTYNETFPLFVSLEEAGMIVNGVIEFLQDDSRKYDLGYMHVYKIREDLYVVLSVDYEDVDYEDVDYVVY